MKIYLAGPMTGYDNFNFPEFDKISAKLRAHGYDVVSPAELDSPEFRAAVMAPGITGYEKGLTGLWGDCLARDVKLIADSGIEGIILMWTWEKSRGARLEAFVGVLCGLKFALYDEDEIGLVQPVQSDWVIGRIAASEFR